MPHLPGHTEEFERLLAQREQLWNRTLRSMAESVIIAGQLPGDDPISRVQQGLGLAQLMQETEEREPLREMRNLDDLIGAAWSYGIWEAESMPLDELEAVVKARRRIYAAEEGPKDVGAALLEAAGNAAALGFVGLTQSSLRLMQNFAERIPFMRDALVRSDTMRDADRWLSMLGETVTRDLPESRRNIARGVAGAVGMFPGAILTWQSLGLIGGLSKTAMIGGRVMAVGRAQLAARMAARGAATELILQDPTAPIYEQGINAAAGAAFGLGDVGGVLGRTVTGVGMGAVAGALAGEGDNRVTAISALLGGLAVQAPSLLTAKVRNAFPSRLIEGIPESEWTTLNPADEVGLLREQERLALPPGQYPAPGVVEGGIELGPTGGRVFNLPGEVAPSFGQVAMETGPMLRRSPASLTTEAANLTKQETIFNSPALPELNGRAALDDSDVALALVETFPGQVGVIQNVGDTDKAIRRILMEQMPNGVGPQDFRVVKRPVRFFRGQPGFFPPTNIPRWFTTDLSIAELYGAEGQVFGVDVTRGIAEREGFGSLGGGDVLLSPEQARLMQPIEQLPPIERPGQTDILVSSGRPITNQMVKDYEAFGVFSGQRALLPTGQEVVIESLNEGAARVRPTHGGPSATVALRDVLPMKSSYLVDNLPEVYGDFGVFAQQRLNDQTRGIGALPIALMDNEAAALIPGLMDEYLQSIQVNPQSYYGAALKQLLEQRHIEALRTLTPPDEDAMLRSVQAQLAETAANAPIREATLDELATARGFSMELPEPVPGTIRLGPTLVDEMSQGELQVPFSSEDEAREFLHNFQREKIDNSPITSVPLEVIETPPGFSMEGGRDPGVFASAEEWADAVHSLDDDLAEQYAQLGEEIFQIGAPEVPGGPRGPVLPPPPPGGLPPASEPFGFFPTPDRAGAFNEAFRRARMTDKDRLRQAVAKLDGVVSKMFTPTRHMAIRFDSLFRPLGIPPIERLVVQLQDAHARMVNDAHPWEQAAYDALEHVRRRVIRDGTLWEILISPREFRPTMMRRAGLTTEEKIAVDELDILFSRFRDQVAAQRYPDLPDNYLHMFQRFEEGLPGDKMRRPRQASWGPTKGHGEIEVAEKDLDAIIARYFRSFYKVEHMNAPYTEIKALTRGGAVPDAVKEWLGGWADARMWGLDPTKDIMLNATHGLLDGLAKAVGLRVSRSEVQGMFHAEMTASYAAGLGARPDAIIRDMPAALLGTTRVGLDRALPVLKKLIGRGDANKEYRMAAMELAYANGWLVRGHGLAVDPDLFGGTAFREVNPDIPQSISQTPFMTGAADIIRGGLSRIGLRRGWQGTWLDPLRAYGWQADWARLWNLMTGYESAWDALRKYDARKLLESASIAQLEQELLDNARVARFQGTIQDGFLEFVRNGDYEGAASYFARHVGDSQNRFGMTEHPSMFRNLGPVTGRKAMKWLTFSSQAMAEVAQLLADPRITTKNKVAYGAQMGALQGLYGITQAMTGWNMMKLSLASIGFTFAGTSIFDTVNGVQRALAWWQQQDPTGNLDPTQNALLATAGTGYGSTFFTLDPTRATWNPWSGAIRTAQGFAESAPFGAEAAARFFVTGERGDPWQTRLQRGQEELAPLWYGQPAVGSGAR